MKSGNVRIVSGEFRGRVLRFPDTGEIRPTSARVREAMFSALASRMDLAGALVVDLFAGSGAFGMEAMSRGAAKVTFVEKSKRLVSALRQNITQFNVGARATVVETDALRWLETSAEGRFDLLLADPPYEQGLSAEIPSLVAKRNLLAEGGCLLIECGRRESIEAVDNACGRLVLLLDRVMGDTRIFLFRWEVGEGIV